MVFLEISASTQVISIGFSFLSLVLSSTRLFYSQRLGKYQELDPSMPMILFVLVFIVGLITGPLCNLVLMSSYYQEGVIIFISLNILSHLFNATAFKKELLEYVKILYGHTNTKYLQKEKEKNELGKVHLDEMIIRAIFTSWISPCTVMSNNDVHKSKFLIVSGRTSFIGHLFGLISVIFFALYADLSQQQNPPITHCFKKGLFDYSKK